LEGDPDTPPIEEPDLDLEWTAIQGAFAESGQLRFVCRKPQLSRANLNRGSGEKTFANRLLKARVESQQPEVEAAGIDQIRVLPRGNREGLGTELERVGHSALALSIKTAARFSATKMMHWRPGVVVFSWRTSTGVLPLIGRCL
jgi:hypothetical protein